MMEAARTSEMLVNFYQTTQHCNPEDSHQLFVYCNFWSCLTADGAVLSEFISEQ
jgi:hypothetical protein